jgi:hypothetical protein
MGDSTIIEKYDESQSFCAYRGPNTPADICSLIVNMVLILSKSVLENLSYP